MTRIISALVLALVLGICSGQAQAETVWHFPYKGTPYAVHTTPLRGGGALATAARPRHATHARAARRLAVSRCAPRRHCHAVAGHARSHSRSRSVWHYPYKGAPYAVHETSGPTRQAAARKPRHAARAGAARSARFAATHGVARRHPRRADGVARGTIVWRFPYKGLPYAVHKASL